MAVEDDILITDEIFLVKSRILDPKHIGFQATTGFASPANTHFKRSIDLNDLVILNKDATYFFKMNTDAMIGVEISKGDSIVVDTEQLVVSGSIIVIWVEGGYRVRQVELFDQMIVLHAANPAYTPIYVHETSAYEYFGVVTFIIKRMHPRP